MILKSAFITEDPKENPFTEHPQEDGKDRSVTAEPKEDITKRP